MNKVTPESESVIREQLEILKGVIDDVLPDPEKDRETWVNGHIHVVREQGVYLVNTNDHIAELAKVEDGEPTFSSELSFRGDNLSIVGAVINVAVEDGDGQRGGFERRIAKSRLPGFVASITAQVVTEVSLGDEITEAADSSSHLDED